jgi:POLQ-like helicase
MRELQMKLERKSKNLLAVTKAKAKMYEFRVAPEYQNLNMPQDPQELLILTIGILGELSAIESKDFDVGNSELVLLRKQLILVSQYFDALDLSEINTEISVYLKILGSCAYYLSDMPGNSSVLSKDLDCCPKRMTPSYLEAVLVWLLKSDITESWYQYENNYLNDDLTTFVDSFKGFYSYDNDENTFNDAAKALREKVYDLGDDKELLFVNLIVSLAKRKIGNSSLKCLPKYTGLGLDDWRPILSKNHFIKELWPAQRLLGEAGVFMGKSAVVQMPTSSGKTKSIELIIRSAFISSRVNVVVVVAPFRAICREITSTFEKVFEGEGINLNELQDVMQVSPEEDDFLKFIMGGLAISTLYSKSIIVTTPEKLVYLLRHEPQLASEIGLLIFDEGHQFDSGKRGVTYELLLASLKESVKETSQKVLISAVMANAMSIGEWLNGESGVDIQGGDCLPTVRGIAFASWQSTLGQLRYINQENPSEEGYFVPRVIDQQNLGVRGLERVDRLFPKKGDNSSVAAYLGLKLCQQGPVAIFCGVKSTVASICSLIIEHYERGLELPKPLLKSDESEIYKISYLASLHFGADHSIPQAIKLGVLPHSANIPNGVRVAVEWAMEHSKACLVICTSTLAQGVNLPIKYLIISSVFQAGKEISTRDFHNLMGRAGRAGYHTEGSVIFSDTTIYDKKGSYNDGWRWPRAIHLLDFKNAEHCLSTLKGLINPFEYELLTTDVIDFVTNPLMYRTQCIDLGTKHSIDTSALLMEMDFKLSLIESIESYFLSYLKDNPDPDGAVFIELAKQTLAYSLANHDEKILLLSAFEIISASVLSLDSGKYAYYGKALLGIDQLKIIDEWVDLNSQEIVSLNTSEEWIDICWPLIELLSKNQLLKKLNPPSIVLEFSKAWINGMSYCDLLAFFNEKEVFIQTPKKQRDVKIDNVIDLADKFLGFDVMLLVGALADVLEGKGFDGQIVEGIRFLQSRLKLGMSSKLELWLYSKGYVDRELCKALALKLKESGVPTDDFRFDVLEIFSTEIEGVLSAYPSYFLKN